VIIFALGPTNKGYTSILNHTKTQLTDSLQIVFQVTDINMHQRKQPRSLEDMSLEVYINIYYEVLEKWNSNLWAAFRSDRRRCQLMKLSVMEEIEQINQTLSEVPPYIQVIICPQLAYIFACRIMSHRDKMVLRLDPVIMGKEGYDQFCVAMFRSVLTPHLKQYKPLTMSNCYKQNLVVQTLNIVPGLTSLCLPIVGHRDRCGELATSIRHLKFLKVFSYMGHCTDEVARQLGLNCPHLTDVSFFLSYKVTNGCVPHLLRLSKLQYLNLQGTQVDNTHYGLLLSQLPDIADIRFRTRADDILDHINVDTLPKITHAYCCGTNNNMLVQRCPKIRKLELNPPAGNLSRLTALTELRALEISHGDYVTSNLNAVLTGIGPNLIQLKLDSIKNVNLRDIVTFCPSLNILVLFQCRYLPLKANAPLDPQLLHFRNLISLKIVRAYDD
jgi:hypothetical protein